MLVLHPFPLLTTPPALVAFVRQEDATSRARTVPLPDPSLSDSAYKADLAILLSDPAKRPGVYTSLARLIARGTTPPHAAVIVELLSGYLDDPNSESAVIPLKVLGRCGAVARPALSRVLTLGASPLSAVRLAVTEALGGMFYAPPGTPPSSPGSVTTILVHYLQTDPDRGTKRAAAVALGRCRVTTRDVLVPLAAVIGNSDGEIALGGLAAAQAMGTDAKLLLPAIKARLADKDTVANAAPALLAVASPQEAIDAMAQTLSDTHNLAVRQTILYYAAQLEKGNSNTTVLANAVKPLMFPSSSSDDAYELKTIATSAYQNLTGDAQTTATSLAALIEDTKAPISARRIAVNQIGKIGKTALDAPGVLSALNLALSESDAGLQGSAVAVLFKFGGPAAQGVAPRLAELLLTAWKNKQDGRAYSLMNAIYRIGPRAKEAATPALKKIIAGEPKGSANAQFAQTVLNKVSEQ